MGKSKAFMFNMVITIIYHLYVVVFGLTVSGCFLIEYGVDIHGLTLTKTNILIYVVLLSTGLLKTSVQVLGEGLKTLLLYSMRKYGVLVFLNIIKWTNENSQREIEKMQ